MTTEAQRRALEEVREERDHQKKRWDPGHDREHKPDDWVLILTVWMGKLAYASPFFMGNAYDKRKFRKRLVQVTAIALAALEAL